MADVSPAELSRSVTLRWYAWTAVETRCFFYWDRRRQRRRSIYVEAHIDPSWAEFLGAARDDPAIAEKPAHRTAGRVKGLEFCPFPDCGAPPGRSDPLGPLWVWDAQAFGEHGGTAPAPRGASSSGARIPIRSPPRSESISQLGHATRANADCLRRSTLRLPH